MVLQGGRHSRWHGGHGRRPTVSRTVADLLSQVLASPLVSTIAFALGAAAIVLWVTAAWWAYRDALIRTDSTALAYGAAGWIVVSTPLLLPLALLVYRAVRPQLAAGDARAERLAIGLSEATMAPTCQGCGILIREGWHRCPACATWLAATCRRCGGWSDPAFEICPFCGHDDPLEPAIDAAAEPLAHAPAPWGHGAPGPSGASAPTGQTVAAAGLLPTAAFDAAGETDQRGVRISASSVRPRSYAASRDSLSASS
jgi:RNA polymerase subunit RPABC4/transcription elongation factor Spt4